MDRQLIIDFWGINNLKRWSEASLRDVGIPDSAKSFLAEVGLPFREDWTIRFELEADYLPRLPDRPTYRRIGFDYIVPICLDEANSGRVIAAEQEIGRTERYVNSTVEHFGEFLTYYQQYRQTGPVLPENQIKTLIDETERQMQTADPSAFSDPNNYWATIIEQMKDGFL